MIQDHPYRELIKRYAPWVLAASWTAVLIWGVLQGTYEKNAGITFTNMPLPEFAIWTAFLPLIGAILLTRKLRAGKMIVYPSLFISLLYTPALVMIFPLIWFGSTLAPGQLEETIITILLILLGWFQVGILRIYEPDDLSDLEVPSFFYYGAYYISGLFWISLAIIFLVSVVLESGVALVWLALFLVITLCPTPLLFIRLARMGRQNGRWGLVFLVFILSPSHLNYVKLIQSADSLLYAIWPICSLIAFASHLLLLMAEPPPPPVIFVARPKSGDSSP